jgi:hypothetical protein
MRLSHKGAVNPAKVEFHPKLSKKWQVFATKGIVDTTKPKKAPLPKQSEAQKVAMRQKRISKLRRRRMTKTKQKAAARGNSPESEDTPQTQGNSEVVVTSENN